MTRLRSTSPPAQGEADIPRGAIINVPHSAHLGAILDEASREAEELLALATSHAAAAAFEGESAKWGTLLVIPPSR